MLFPGSNFVKSRQGFREHLSEHIVLMKKHKFDRTAAMLELYDEELVHQNIRIRYQNIRIRELELKLIQAVDSRLELAKVRMVLSKSGIDLDVLMKTEEVFGE